MNFVFSIKAKEGRGVTREEIEASAEEYVHETRKLVKDVLPEITKRRRGGGFWVFVEGYLRASFSTLKVEVANDGMYTVHLGFPLLHDEDARVFKSMAKEAGAISSCNFEDCPNCSRKQ